MSGGVFVLTGPDNLVPMAPASFATEADFQRLLARFPTLLGGIQDESGVPRQWLLVGQETGIPSEENGSDRFAVDHLFLDQDGVPTLVEVKRQGDTRLRRLVIAQILDYAANAVLHWSAEKLKDQFTARYADEATAASALSEFVGNGGDPDTWWDKVSLNLKAGRIRLLLVADMIPPEVKGIVEFLNRQMASAEFLAVELRQYEGQGLRTIVPTVFGQIEGTQNDGGEPKRQWDETSIFEALSRNVAPPLVQVARRIASWVIVNADEVVFGRGVRDGSMGPGFRCQSSRLLAIQLWTSGSVTMNFGYMTKAPFDDPAIRQGWVDQVRAIPGVSLPSDAAGRYPNIGLSMLAPHIDQFLAAMDWLVSRLRAPSGNGEGAPADQAGSEPAEALPKEELIAAAEEHISAAT